MADSTPKLTEAIVMEWLKTTDGRWFTTVQMDKDLSIQTPQGRNSRRVILHRFTKENILEKHGRTEGMYRLRLDVFDEIDFKTADPDAYLPVRLPFNLHEYVRLYAKNLGVIAGASNAGKTAFLFNIIKLNQDIYNNSIPIEGGMGGDGIVYFSSEMGPEELCRRLSKFEDTDIQSWNFKAVSLSENFVDAIRPNALNIIDYWEFADSEFYRIADSFREITKRLNKGLCFIALQKKRGAEYGRGAELSLEKPRLYVSIDPGILTVVKGKNWAQEGVNPNGMKIRFSLVGGANFVQVSEPFWPDKEKQ